MQEKLEDLLAGLVHEDYCYLTTTGRVSGNPHEIEIWFGTQGTRIYLLAGDHRSDWVLNSLKDPQVKVGIASHFFTGWAGPVNDKEEEMQARYLLAEKYQEWENGRTLSNWARTALVMGIDLSRSGKE
jgi:hypothetical protein